MTDIDRELLPSPICRFAAIPKMLFLLILNTSVYGVWNSVKSFFLHPERRMHHIITNYLTLDRSLNHLTHRYRRNFITRTINYFSVLNQILYSNRQTRSDEFVEKKIETENRKYSFQASLYIGISDARTRTMCYGLLHLKSAPNLAVH